MSGRAAAGEAREGDLVGRVADLRGKTLGGRALGGDGTLQLVELGSHGMLVRLCCEPGFEQAGHAHPGHESFGYVLSGELRMRIGDEQVTLGPGESWHHAIGVYHEARADVPTEALELHMPVRPDVLDLFRATP
jgi:quercetin dioxygenase-like cupin family protein